MRVHVDRVVRARRLRCVNQLSDHFVAVRSARILGADRYLSLGAGQTVAHATHIHADRFGHARWNGSGAAVPDFLVDRNVNIHAAREGDAVVGKVLCKSEQDADRQLIVEKTAFDVARRRNARAGIEANDVADLDSERAGVIGAFHVLVKQNLGGVEGALGVGKRAVDVNRRVAELERALDDAPRAGVDPHIFGFAVFGAHSAEVGQAQSAVALDLRDHAAERVGVRLEKQGVFRIRAAEVDENAALVGEGCGEAERFEFFFDPIRRDFGKPCRAVDCKQFHGFFHRVGCVLFHHDSSFVSV